MKDKKKLKEEFYKKCVLRKKVANFEVDYILNPESMWEWIEAALKTQREETLRDIRKWTKGRNVTKDALRNYLNILDKLK